MREYDLIADWYAAESEGRTSGVREALDAVASLTPSARIFDVGCGNGIPITDALARAGYTLVGLDTSERMLARFRTNMPATPAVRGDARRCPFGTVAVSDRTHAHPGLETSRRKWASIRSMSGSSPVKSLNAPPACPTAM